MFFDHVPNDPFMALIFNDDRTEPFFGTADEYEIFSIWNVSVQAVDYRPLRLWMCVRLLFVTGFAFAFIPDVAVRIPGLGTNWGG